MIRSRIAALVAIATLSILSGCLFGSSSHTTFSGKRVSEETLAMIDPGDSADSVVGLLGEPTSKSEKADGSEIWKWHYEQTTKSSGAVLFLVGTSDSSESSGAVYVQIMDGKVVKTWRD